jgi:hypothetical protein
VLWDVAGRIGVGLRQSGGRSEQLQAKITVKIGRPLGWRPTVALGSSGRRAGPCLARKVSRGPLSEFGPPTQNRSFAATTHNHDDLKSQPSPLEITQPTRAYRSCSCGRHSCGLHQPKGHTTKFTAQACRRSSSCRILSA